MHSSCVGYVSRSVMLRSAVAVNSSLTATHSSSVGLVFAFAGIANVGTVDPQDTTEGYRSDDMQTGTER